MKPTTETRPLKLTDFARSLPDEVWNLFEPLLPAVVWAGNGRPPVANRPCLHAVFYILISGIAWRMLPVGFPSYRTVQRRLKLWLKQDTFLIAWTQLATRYQQLHGINWDQILLDGSKKPAKKGGEDTGRSPVDRGKSGTALHIACDARAMPLAIFITGANANDGVQTEKVLNGLVVEVPAADISVSDPDPRSLPRAQADGAYGNKPSQARALRAGFRLQAPKRGEKRPGVGKIRNPVERCHNFLAQFGRIFRRFDRVSKNDLGWAQMAACVIFLRSGFVA